MNVTEIKLRAMNRRQQVIEFLAEPHTSFEVMERFKVSSHCVREDMEYLKNVGIVLLHSGTPRSKQQNRAKYIAKQVRLTLGYGNQELNFGEYPEFLQSMLGFAKVNPTGGTKHLHLDHLVRPQPLRKLNTAWMGYQSALEAA
jgi:hypothetical protein